MSERVQVLAGEVGEVGGAAKATRLLCESLAELGLRVQLFVTLPPAEAVRAQLGERGIEILSPPLNRGWRFQLPQRQIALRLFGEALRHRPRFVHTVGLGVEARFLLALPRVARVYLWEPAKPCPM